MIPAGSTVRLKDPAVNFAGVPPEEMVAIRTGPIMLQTSHENGRRILRFRNYSLEVGIQFAEKYLEVIL